MSDLTKDHTATLETENQTTTADSEPEAAAAEPETTVEAAAPDAAGAEPAAAEPTAAEAPDVAVEASDGAAAVEVAGEAQEAEPREAEAPAGVAEESAAPAGETAAAAEPAEPAAAADTATVAEGTVAVGEAVGETPADSEVGATMALLEKAQAEKTAVTGQVIGWNKGGYHVAVGKIAAFCPVSQIEIGNPRSPKRYLDKNFPFHVIEIQQGGRRVVLSRAAALQAEKEARAALVRERLKVGDVVEGKVSSLTEFGAFVDLGGGIEGLVHISEISRRRVEHPKEAVKNGQTVNVSVLKIEKNGERISLSMKRLEDDPWKGVGERYKAGADFTGTILRKTDFGLFVEVEPGLEGLVHLSRLPLGKEIGDESLEVGKEVSGWIHEVEPRRRRLSLSLREMVKGNPWTGIAERFPVGEVKTGKVERLTDFGVFVELEPGLTGLLPFSMLTGAGNPRRKYHPGKEIAVRVLAVDQSRKRISLGTETSTAEGNQQDYKEYLKAQRSGGGLSAMAAAFAKIKDQTPDGPNSN